MVHVWRAHLGTLTILGLYFFTLDVVPWGAVAAQQGAIMLGGI